MGISLFLAPCDSPNFDDTVLSPVDLAEFPDHPTAFSEKDKVRFWGVREGTQNRNYFEKMQSGDLVLFYQNGSYVGLGRIGTKFEDEDEWASTTFWRNAPSNLIYTIQKFRSIRVPKSAVNRIFGYVDDYNPEGLIRVSDNRLNNRPKAIERALIKYTEKHS